MSYHIVHCQQLIWSGGTSQLPFILKNIDQAYNADNSTVVIGSLLVEGFYNVTTDFIEFIKEVKKRNIPLIMVINYRVENTEMSHTVTELGVDIVYIDWNFWRVYQEIIVKQVNKTNQAWNRTATKFLCLTGKPARAHRVGLLWKLHKQDLLNLATWSLYVPDSDKAQVINILTSMGANIEQAEKFIQEYQDLSISLISRVSF